ncbi:MAG: carbohydrate kinase family protein [Bacteroidetes bacterium]|nr:carbohydrate kinase family protein [Bacteroidota bacterium]
MNKSIAFIGNASIDEITTARGKFTSYGGSAVNSSLAASLLTDESIYLTTAFGYDYPTHKFDSLKGISLEFSRIDEMASNRFLINEVDDTLSFVNEKYLDIILNKQLIAGHVHLSCRKGVNPIQLLSALHFDSLSIDVMKFSLTTMWEDIVTLAKKATVCFCNREEYQTLMEQREQMKSLTFIVTHRDGVDIFSGDSEINVALKSVPEIDFQSTTGAGDTFLGGFLASYTRYGDLHKAALSGQVVAKYSLAAFGNWHLYHMKDEILKEINKQ